MPPAGDDKIKIEWDDLNTRKVDQRLREQEAMARNRQQADRVPVMSDVSTGKQGFFSHPAIVMALFGLLGGLLAWGAREAFRLRTDLKAEADLHRQELRALDEKDQTREQRLQTQRNGLAAMAKLTPDQADKYKQASADLEIQSATAKKEIDDARHELANEYGDNPYFKTYADTTTTPPQKESAVAELDKAEAPKKFIATLASFGLTGLLISVCLSVADPLTAGNKSAALLNGLLGAILGLIGGVAASFFFEKIYQSIASGAPAPGLDPRQIVARSASWGVLGLFLAIGPGLAMSRNVQESSPDLHDRRIDRRADRRGGLFEPVRSSPPTGCRVDQLGHRADR